MLIISPPRPDFCGGRLSVVGSSAAGMRHVVRAAAAQAADGGGGASGQDDADAGGKSAGSKAQQEQEDARTAFAAKFLAGSSCQGERRSEEPLRRASSPPSSAPKPQAKASGAGGQGVGQAAPAGAGGAVTAGTFATALELRQVGGSGRTESCLCCCGPYLVGMSEPPCQRVTVWGGADQPLGSSRGLLYSLPATLNDRSTLAGEGPGDDQQVVVGHVEAEGDPSAVVFGVWRLRDGQRLPNIELPVAEQQGPGSEGASVLAVDAGGHALCHGGGRLWVIRLGQPADDAEGHAIALSVPMSEMVINVRIDPKRLPKPCYLDRCGGCVKCLCLRYGESIQGSYGPLTSKAAFLKRLERHTDASGALLLRQSAVSAPKCGALWRDRATGHLMAAVAGSGWRGLAVIDVDGSVAMCKLLMATAKCSGACNTLSLWPGKGANGATRLVAGTQGRQILQLDARCVVSNGQSSHVELLEVSTLDLRRVWGLRDFAVYSLVLAPDGKHWVAASAWSRDVQILDLDRNKRVRSERVWQDGCREPERANVWKVAAGRYVLFVSGQDDSLGPSEIHACAPKAPSSRKRSRPEESSDGHNTINDSGFLKRVKALQAFLRAPLR